MLHLVLSRLAKVCARVVLVAVLLVPAMGAAAIPINQFDGQWQLTATYQMGYVVRYNGSSYVCLIANNMGIAPDTHPLAWAVLAS